MHKETRTRTSMTIPDVLKLSRTPALPSAICHGTSWCSYGGATSADSMEVKSSWSCASTCHRTHHGTVVLTRQEKGCPLNGGCGCTTIASSLSTLYVCTSITLIAMPLPSPMGGLYSGSGGSMVVPRDLMHSTWGLLVRLVPFALCNHCTVPPGLLYRRPAGAVLWFFQKDKQHACLGIR